MNEPMIAAMKKNSADDFSKAAEANTKFRPLALCALDYAKEGITSLNEVFRISASLGDGG